jgi:D-psicose/D-tagatose/L-ribulose 3-epimerase
MMKFSICSWIFGNAPIYEVMKFVASCGYDAIEVRAAVDEYNWKEISLFAKKLSLEISGLTGDTSWPNEEHDLANKDPWNRRKAIDYFKRQIEAVNEVGGSYLGVCPSAVGKSKPMQNPGNEWEWALESISSLAEFAKQNEVILVIEPLNRYESVIVNTAKEALRFVQEINHPYVKTMLDTYHMNIEEADMESPFLELGSLIEIIHVADSNRQAIGRGHINFDKVVSAIKKIKFDKTIVVECCAPGPNPFSAEKGEHTWEYITKFAEESIIKLKEWF